jgi:signal transduction histidine kinase
MERLVNDLLLLARTEEGGRLELEEVEIGGFLADQLEAVRPIANGRIELGAVVDGTVEADPHALAQAIRNLVRNALEHTRAGGSVRLSAEPQGDGIELAVEDDGPGIPPAERSRVFERFHRVRQGTGKGSGLGLAIARAIVEAHGGTIRADEARGGGARVSLWLPGFRSRRPAAIELDSS